MKNILIIISVTQFFACNQKNITSYSYFIKPSIFVEKNIISDDFQQKNIRYISFKNYLFEFLESTNAVTAIENNNVSKKQFSKPESINVIPKNKGILFQIDSFSISCKILDCIDFSKKDAGININNKDSMPQKMLNQFSIDKTRDTIINNWPYKVKDTSFYFTDTIRVKNYYFYTKIFNLNTIFNINYTNQADKDGYILVGIMGIINESYATGYLVNNITPLSKADNLICEAIISKIEKYSFKKNN
jgi:hypothetical protein